MRCTASLMFCSFLVLFVVVDVVLGGEVRGIWFVLFPLNIVVSVVIKNWIFFPLFFPNILHLCIYLLIYLVGWLVGWLVGHLSSYLSVHSFIHSFTYYCFIFLSVFHRAPVWGEWRSGLLGGQQQPPVVLGVQERGGGRGVYGERPLGAVPPWGRKYPDTDTAFIVTVR